jgi:RNA recognition motif-containing protein
MISLFFQGERGRPRDGSSRSVANQRPTKTLFMINFDANRTTARDIERHFEPYGKILHVRIRRNFAFVQFETQEDATKALKCTDMRLVTGLTMIMVFLSVCMIHQTNECSVILQQAVRQGGIS